MLLALSNRHWAGFLYSLSFLATLILTPGAVKEDNFKKCNQSGFCTRNRHLADHATAAGSRWTSPYTVAPESVTFSQGQVHATILKTVKSGTRNIVNLPVTISFYESGVARVTIDEEMRQKRDIVLRHNSKARKERYNQAEKLVIVGGTTLDTNAKVSSQDKKQMTVKYGPNHSLEAVIHFSPFAADFNRDGQSHVRFNERGFLNMEHWRPKEDKANEIKADGGDGAQKPQEQAQEGASTSESAISQELGDSTLWEETFGGNTDSKPRGPESLGLDISFPGYGHVYGIPSHTGPLSLKETRGGEGNYAEPYRMYNADVFEYILDSPMTLYGSIPFMQAHRPGSSVGILWLNAAETWVDIVKKQDATAKSSKTTQTHWVSEAGLLDVFVFMGPTPRNLTAKLGELTGFTAMPQEFALGYHQCRWNYISVDDVKDVARKMDKHQIPFDVIWLDIEFADDKQYFKWDPDKFKSPESMNQALEKLGRKLVLINDPHLKIKDGYQITTEAKAKQLVPRNKDDAAYEGHCWPGGSHWLDAFNPAAIEWWKEQFKYSKFVGTTPNTFFWNDMNEPSVFNGPETTMPKDNLHYDNWEHRDLHNLNGMTFHNATYQALLSRAHGELQRPFVLTRSFFAGSQRFGPMWTGDNLADWGHLAGAVPMLLSQGVAGYPFSGADVGGFFGNPDKELQTRWYQAGAFYPFFRGHAHIDARRREPYLAGEPYTEIITNALRLRYSLLPSWYTAFRQAHVDGTPIIKAMHYTHPDEESALEVDDQLFVGTTGLLHKPVVVPGQDKVDMYIPDNEVYYDYFNYKILPTKKGHNVTLDTPLEKVALLMRGGHIFPRRDCPRRSSALMRFDPYTLVVVVGRNGKAEGDLYVDDGHSFDYQHGQYISRKFRLDGNVLSSVDADGRTQNSVKPGEWMKQMQKVKITTIIVVGAPAKWSAKLNAKVETSGGKTVKSARVEFVPAQDHGATAAHVVIKGLEVGVAEDWSLEMV